MLWSRVHCNETRPTLAMLAIPWPLKPIFCSDFEPILLVWASKLLKDSYADSNWARVQMRCLPWFAHWCFGHLESKWSSSIPPSLPTPMEDWLVWFLGKSILVVVCRILDMYFLITVHATKDKVSISHKQSSTLPYLVHFLSKSFTWLSIF